MSPLSWTMLVVMCLVTVSRADMNDVDSMDSSSDTSSTGEMDNDIQPVDPNLVNPPSGQGYGNEMRNNNPEDWPQNRDKTSPRPPGSPTQTPAVRPTWSEQSLRALLQFGIIVGVAIMVGSMFMAMVYMEMLYDHLCDKIRELCKNQKPLPDIERLHPAELVGTFSRYK